MGKYQAEQFAHAKGQADLVLRHDGKWFLLVTVDVPESAPIPATDFMGVDFGVVNLATTEDGDKSSGRRSTRPAVATESVAGRWEGRPGQAPARPAAQEHPPGHEADQGQGSPVPQARKP